jgi:hypothetical protein
LVPTDSGAATLRPSASTTTLRSPDCLGADLPTAITTRVDLWPPPAMRETCTFGAPPPRINKDWRRRGAVSESSSCGVLGVDAEPVDLTHDWCLCKEFASGRSGPSKRWRDGVGRSSDRLSGSARRGESLRSSGACGPPGATRGRTTRWSSQVGRAANHELEPTFFSCAAACGRRDNDTYMERGGDEVDDPNSRSNPPPQWPRRRSTTALAMDLHWRRRSTPAPSAS